MAKGNGNKKTQELKAEDLGRASDPHWPKNSSIFIPDDRLENLKAYRYSGTDKSLVSVSAFCLAAMSSHAEGTLPVTSRSDTFWRLVSVITLLMLDSDI